MDFDITFLKSKNNYWFAFLWKGDLLKIDDNFPVWFCIDSNYNLVHVSNNPQDESQFIVSFFKQAKIRRIIVSESIFYILNPDIKSVMSRKEPYKMILWSKLGYVRSVVHENFYYEYNSDGSILKIVNTELGDAKIYLEDKIIAEIDLDDMNISVNYDKKITKEDFPLDPIAYNRLKNIEAWVPFPVYNLQRTMLPYECDEDHEKCFSVILDHPNVLYFKVFIVKDGLKMVCK